MSLASEIDDRSVAEQLHDLGVPIERPKQEVTDVRWTSPSGKHKTSKLIRVSKRGVYMTPQIAGDLQWQAMFGTGRYKGQTVLLIRHDAKGYKPSVPGGRNNYKSRRPYVSSPRMLKELFDAGLKEGLYEPIKIKGGWMGVPVEVEK